MNPQNAERRPVGGAGVQTVEIPGDGFDASTVADRPDNPHSRENDAQPFQLLPPLSEAEYAALRADIAARGILVPVVVDQHGRILDGHHRSAIAAELHLACPVEVRTVADDADAGDLAVTLNCTRRHLNREQRRDLIAAEILRRPDDSDRAIARRVGCSPSTIGAVRLSNLDTPGWPFTLPMDRAKAEECTRRLQVGLCELLDRIDDGIDDGISPARWARVMRESWEWTSEAIRPVDAMFMGYLARAQAAAPEGQVWVLDDAEMSAYLASLGGGA